MTSPKMYSPPRFQSTNRDAAFALMDQNPFATVITTTPHSAPVISHLPLTPKREGEDIVLLGHLAKANPHWKELSAHPTTAIFHGPHTYITPTWYAENDVPTWNYSVMHITGPIEMIEDEAGLITCLKELSAHAESHWPSGWDFFIPDDLSGDVLTKSIVGFRLRVSEMQFKTKLSQNRSAADRVGILQGLATRTDDNSRAVLAEMEKLFEDNGAVKN